MIISGLMTNEHKNVTHLTEYFQDKKYYYLVYEYNHGSSLLDYVCESSYFNERMVASILKQMLSAIIYMQGKELFHKNICPENLMVEDSLIDIPCIKINDFSTAVEFKPKDKKVRKFRKMTFTCLYFTPPEVIEDMGYNDKSDVWSVGILMLYLLSGTIPVKGPFNKVTLEYIKSRDLKIGELVEKKVIDAEAGKLLSKMLNRNPEERISAIEALNDPWVIKHSKCDSIDSVTKIDTKKVIKLWDYYSLQSLCMQYFGLKNLDSLNIDMIKNEAAKQEKKETDELTYDELFKILVNVYDNSKETVAFELDQVLLDVDYNQGKPSA